MNADRGADLNRNKIWDFSKLLLKDAAELTEKRFRFFFIKAPAEPECIVIQVDVLFLKEFLCNFC